jgi:predicted negative regulator of RcsB-dependent stress response
MALDEILDEHEQSERVRAWLRRNGAGLIGGIALGLAAVGGWKWWEGQQQAEQAAMSARYQTIVESLAAGDLAQQARIASLEGTYRTLASLSLANAQLAKNDRDAAITTLRGIRADDAALRSMVSGRLARLLVDAGKADEALKLLADADTALALEVRGDAQFALGRNDQARESYQKALTRLEVDAPQRRLLELKLTQVGGTPSKPEART